MPGNPPAVPPLPSDIIGQNVRRKPGRRINSDLPADQFEATVDRLTGRVLTADAVGNMICANGVRIRHGRAGRGPRIDIPANDTKVHETTHFPFGTPWPW